MKPVQKVSIGGYAFTLEDDACRLVSEYLSRLETYYSSRHGGSEIMEGIEERMAELLLEKNGSNDVAGVGTVQQIIGILGRPEAIEAESDLDGAGAEELPGTAMVHPVGKAEERPLKRRLYRDLEYKMLGGVCSGLGVFTKVDPLVYRLVFVVFSLFDVFHFFRTAFGHWRGSPFHINLIFPLIYVILWGIIPPARTVRRRWEMRGETGSVEDIERKVENSFEEIGAAMGNFGRRTEKVIREVGSSPIGKTLGRIFLVCVGVILLVIGVAIAVGLFGYWQGFLNAGFSRSYLWSQLTEEWPLVADFLTKPLSIALILLVIGLPAIGMIYAGIMLLFDLKAPNWHPGLVVFVLWLIALVALSVLVAMSAIAGTLPWT